jgi:endonuclease/exonuclease/phosphatase family metal-dependent hydrolase
MTRLRVASYNVKDLTADPAAAARVVRALDPDVLCLQEVPRRAFAGRRVASFARACRLAWPGGHRGSGGTTLFLGRRVALLGAVHRRLPVRFPDRTRGYAVARLALPGHPPLAVASVHLGLRAAERVRHARAVLTAVGADGREDGAGVGADDGPVLVAGDLNEAEGGAALALLTGTLRLVSPAEPTFPSSAPRSRLDVVLASPSLAVLPHQAVPLDEADLRAASDHRPVWVDLEL